MANLNKVMLIGRLTRKPEVRTFSNGGKVAKFGFAVNNRKKNQTTGEWEDAPVFLDVEAFNRGEFGKTADMVEQHLDKGRQIFIEGHLRMDQWETDGQKRSKLVVVVENFQFLDAKPDGVGNGGGGMSQAPRASSTPVRQAKPSFNDHSGGSNYDEPGPMDESPARGGSGGQEDDIPF